MRIALISDIHGNLHALNAVLEDIQRVGADRTVCLGDIATLGPQPREVMDRVREFTCARVKGNHDGYLLDPSTVQNYMSAPWFIENLDWCRNHLEKEDFDFLRESQPYHRIALGGNADLLCVHGSPLSDTDIILATTPEDKLDEMLGDFRATVIAGGHSHVQMMRRHRGMSIINVGSVGLPFETAYFKKSPRLHPWAEYAIVGWENGRLSIDLRRVPVDITAVLEIARKSSMPDRLDWIKNWITP